MADPTRDVVLQQIVFREQTSTPADYKLYALLAPHLALRAIASLQDDYGQLRRQYVDEWTQWLGTLQPLDEACPTEDRAECINRFRISAAVLRTHEEKRIAGGIIASLSIPWGFAKGDEDLGGYHLTWPRDLVETAGALIAADAHGDALRVLHYLQVTQEPDGHWAQNMWLDGRPYWNGIQMDETALPILLVDLAYRQGTIDDRELSRLRPMVRRAASYIVCNGPVTQQDRWEEDAGFSPFTLAAEITALLAICREWNCRRGPAGIATITTDMASNRTEVRSTARVLDEPAGKRTSLSSKLSDAVSVEEATGLKRTCPIYSSNHWNYQLLLSNIPKSVF